MSKVSISKTQLLDAQRAIRETRFSDFLPSAVLSERQWEIDYRLRQDLSSKGWVILAGSALSAFFDPNSHRGLDRDLVFNSSVLFSVLSVPPEGEAVLMVIEPGHALLEDFLTRQQVAWLHDAPHLQAREFSDAITQKVIAGKLPTIGERRPIRTSELQVANELVQQTCIELERNAEAARLISASPNGVTAKDLADMSPRLLHEVSLMRLMPRRRPRLTDDQMQIARTSPIDILVHGRTDNNRPLLAIEIDGPGHLEPDQAAKDRRKDAVLTSIQLPLIRITQTEADFWTLPSSLGQP